MPTATLQNEAAIYDFREQQAGWIADVGEAPTFRPTPEEFADPLGYIASIQAEAAKYGLPHLPPPPPRRRDPPLLLAPSATPTVTQSCVPQSSPSFKSASQAFARSYRQWEQRYQLAWCAVVTIAPVQSPRSPTTWRRCGHAVANICTPVALAEGAVCPCRPSGIMQRMARRTASARGSKM